MKVSYVLDRHHYKCFYMDEFGPLRQNGALLIYRLGC